MDEFSQHLNQLLVEAYDSITLIEEQMVQSAAHLNLTISEIHLLEAVGRHEPGGVRSGRTISELSEDMNLTLPSVTVAINKLVKKGYVEKNRGQEDGRVVRVTLTREGRRVDSAHRYFHKKMIAAVAEELTDGEKAAMVKGIEKLNAFFDTKIIRS